MVSLLGCQLKNRNDPAAGTGLPPLMAGLRLAYIIGVRPLAKEQAMAKEVTSEQALERARRMSERYVEKGPYEFFPLPEIVDEVQRGLAKNLVSFGHLYCP